MPSVWITHPHNLHCPTCDAHLIGKGGRNDVMERPDPHYVFGGPTLCPDGHALPEDDELYAARDRAGLPQQVQPEEVAPPR